VFIPELAFGEHRLRDLKLPAIDLSPIGNACGAKSTAFSAWTFSTKWESLSILNAMLLRPPRLPPMQERLYDQMETAMHHCNTAFELGKATELEECFDPEIVYSPHKENFAAAKQVMDYLQRRFMQYSPALSYKMYLRDVKVIGDATLVFLRL